MISAIVTIDMTGRDAECCALAYDGLTAFQFWTWLWCEWMKLHDGVGPRAPLLLVIICSCGNQYAFEFGAYLRDYACPRCGRNLIIRSRAARPAMWFYVPQGDLNVLN